MGSFDGIADVLAIALSNMRDNFTVVVSDWSRVCTIGSLLAATIVHLVCTINADKHTGKSGLKQVSTTRPSLVTINNTPFPKQPV